MLKKLKIQDFRNHRRRVVRFGLVTTIVGNNGEGKSSLLRCLKWICLNGYLKDPVRWGRKVTRNTLWVDGVRITREKGASLNTYKLSGGLYKAFGQNVPGDIANLLNVGPHNFQGQFDGHFLLSIPAGQISKELNKIVNLSSIDDCLSIVRGDLYQAKTVEAVSRGRINDAKERRNQLAYVTEMDKDLKELEKLESLQRSAETRRISMQEKLDELKTLERSKGESLDLGDLQKMVDRWATLIQQTADMRQTLERLTTLESRLCRQKANLEKLKRKLASVRKCPVCGNKMDR